MGEDPPRARSIAARVTDFGADPTGREDSTDAFKAAIQRVDSGVILIPAGTYHLSDILWIRKSGIVLRGEDEATTVLRFTKAMEDVRPTMSATSEGRPTSSYSWSGGFIWVKGDNVWVDSAEQRPDAVEEPQPVMPLARPARRGDHVVDVVTPASFSPGELVSLVMQENGDGTLLDHMYGGQPGNSTKINRPIRTAMVSRVRSVQGTRVELERPLRLDARPEWSARLMPFQPTVTDVGIESLTIEFPVTPYMGHFTERGLNGIALSRVADCWVRDVTIRNCDSGMFLEGVFCTASGITIESERTPDALGFRGHHGISMGVDGILDDFDIRMVFIHDITMNLLACGNVVKNGRADRLSIDHHKRAPHHNLFTNLDAGVGDRLWRHGGGRDWGRAAGAYTTFWGIRAEHPLSWPPNAYGPDLMNLVGLRSDDPPELDAEGRWFEPIDVDQLEPADLHAAQLERRRMAGRDESATRRPRR